MSLNQIKNATRADTTLQMVVSLIKSGDWRSAADDALLRPYFNVHNELIVNVENDIVLRQSRIVLPASLHNQAIQIAHEEHQGVVKTKQLLRTKVWFPGIDKLAEATVRSCVACQATTPATHIELLQMTELPHGPWESLSADYLGPLPSGEYLLVMMDNYSRFPVVDRRRCCHTCI